jgi:HAD superfamily hydrolase (TIGR01484 family)
MRFLALACDYDGTLAHDGKVDGPTLAALERARASGRRLILVSGRERPDLERTFGHLELFDRAVLENGALLYHPAAKSERLLAPAPPPAFADRLKQLGVAPLAVGRAIVATWRPHEHAVLEAIRELGLELQVIFNKEAVMVLPSGVNKASGLAAALGELGLSPHNVVAVGTRRTTTPCWSCASAAPRWTTPCRPSRRRPTSSPAATTGPASPS